MDSPVWFHPEKQEGYEKHLRSNRIFSMEHALQIRSNVLLILHLKIELESLCNLPDPLKVHRVSDPAWKNIELSQAIAGNLLRLIYV